jgi:hypothetical protein
MVWVVERYGKLAQKARKRKFTKGVFFGTAEAVR